MILLFFQKFGPDIVSVLLNPSVPSTNYCKRIFTFITDEVKDTLVPKDEPKAGSVPILIPVVTVRRNICNVLKTLVPFTVLSPFTPVISSVWSLPSGSLPVIVSLTDALLDELEILTVDFKFS